jgi:hypothetical protein
MASDCDPQGLGQAIRRCQADVVFAGEESRDDDWREAGLFSYDDAILEHKLRP